MRPATAPEAHLSAQGYPMGPKREPSSFAGQAFCARSSRWSRCSCSRPWPSVHFSCAPLLNTHARAHTHARIHTHAPPGNAPHRAGRRRTRTGPGHTRRSWAHAPRSRTRLSTHTRTRHQTAPLEALYNPLQVLRPGARGRNPHALAAAAVLLHLDRLLVRLPHEQGLAPDQPLLPRRLHGASPRAATADREQPQATASTSTITSTSHLPPLTSTSLGAPAQAPPRLCGRTTQPQPHSNPTAHPHPITHRQLSIATSIGTVCAIYQARGLGFIVLQA